MKNNSNELKKNEQYAFIRNLEIGFLVVATILLSVGVMIVMYGSTSMAKYYVDPVDANNFFSSMQYFLEITIKYSTAVYGGLLVIACSVIAFVVSIIAFVYDFEFFQQKENDINTVINNINPENKKVPTVKVGAEYVPDTKN